MMNSVNSTTPLDTYLDIRKNLDNRTALIKEFTQLKRKADEQIYEERMAIKSQIITNKSLIKQTKKQRKEDIKKETKALRIKFKEDQGDLKLDTKAIEDNLKATLRKVDAVFVSLVKNNNNPAQIESIRIDRDNYKTNLIATEKAKIEEMTAALERLKVDFKANILAIKEKAYEVWSPKIVAEKTKFLSSQNQSLKQQLKDLKQPHKQLIINHRKLVAEKKAIYISEIKQYNDIINNNLKHVKGMMAQAEVQDKAAYKNVIGMYKQDEKAIRKRKLDDAEKRAFRNVNPAYIYLLPAFFGSIFFTILPFVFMLVASQFKLNFFNLSASEYVGFKNFVNIFTRDKEFQLAMRNTIIFSITIVGLLTLVTLSLAAWMAKDTKIHNLAQSMVFTPHIASLVSISILWIAMLNPTGIINTITGMIVGLFGVKDYQGPGWLVQKDTSLFSVALVAVWKDIGYYVLIIIAGLQSIPAYVYEAAKLDKAKKGTTFFKITVPLLMPTLSFVFVTKFINSFKVFAPIEIMTAGGPLGSSMVLSYWVYKSGRLAFNYGNAMSGAIILTIIIAIFTFFNHRFMKRSVKY